VADVVGQRSRYWIRDTGSSNASWGDLRHMCRSEKAASTHALKNIGHVLEDPSWERSALPSAIIQRLSDWTFGERHLSWRCVGASVTATAVFCITFSWEFVGPPIYNSISMPALSLLFVAAEFVLVGIVPDYLALWKSRLLLKKAIRPGRSLSRAIMMILVDVGASGQ
jgi:hypothetical protein